MQGSSIKQSSANRFWMKNGPVPRAITDSTSPGPVPCALVPCAPELEFRTWHVTLNGSSVPVFCPTWSLGGDSVMCGLARETVGSHWQSHLAVAGRMPDVDRFRCLPKCGAPMATSLLARPGGSLPSSKICPVGRPVPGKMGTEPSVNVNTTNTPRFLALPTSQTARSTLASTSKQP